MSMCECPHRQVLKQHHTECGDRRDGTSLYIVAQRQQTSLALHHSQRALDETAENTDHAKQRKTMSPASLPQ